MRLQCSYLVKRDCKFAMFWLPDQESVLIYASIILDAQKHLLFPSIIYQGLSSILPTVSLDSTRATSEISISGTDVFKALTVLDTSKAMGIDGIGPKILNSCALALHEPLFHLFFSLSLMQHYLPAQWCIHLITQIHKSGDNMGVLSILSLCHIQSL